MDGTTEAPGPIGVVVVDHGSRRTVANQWHEEFVRRWRPGDRYVAVEPAHMELAEPSLATAFAACVAAGAATVVIAPYFLWPGSHWERDLPALAAAVAADHPGVRHLVAAPLGPHPALLGVVDERVGRCLERAAGDGPDCELCREDGGCQLL